jgi:hypothetical protein
VSAVTDATASGEPRPPERAADADSYADAYREAAGPTPGSVADYRHRVDIWVRDRLADLGLGDRPAATERPEHGGHPREAVSPAGDWPAPHGGPARVPATEADRIEQVREGDIGWVGAVRHSPTVRGAVLGGAIGLSIAVVLLGAAARAAVGLGGATPSPLSALGLAVVAIAVGVPGARSASRALCLLGASVRPDADDATEAEQRWRCAACRAADRAWADGDRDVTPTPVGEWDVPARVRGRGSELVATARLDAEGQPVAVDHAPEPDDSLAQSANDSPVADGGETPVAFAAAVSDREEGHD